MASFEVLSGLFVGLTAVASVVGFVAGRTYARKLVTQDPEALRAGVGTVSAGVFGLLSLLLAFTFAGAERRFDERRSLILEETNTIGTAYRRIDLLPPDAQPRLRAAFIHYIDERLATYRSLPNIDAARAHKRESERLQDAIWSAALAASALPSDSATKMLTVNVLNPMLDITTTRHGAAETHPPFAVYILLGALTTFCFFLLGFDIAPVKAFSRAHVVGFAVIVLLTLWVVLNFETPRLGFIQVEPMDHFLYDLRATMHE